MKVCPLFLIAGVDPADNPFQRHLCIQEDCQWWVQAPQGDGCAIDIIAKGISVNLAIRFPSTVTDHRQVPRRKYGSRP